MKFRIFYCIRILEPFIDYRSESSYFSIHYLGEDACSQSLAPEAGGGEYQRYVLT